MLQLPELLAILLLLAGTIMMRGQQKMGGFLLSSLAVHGGNVLAAAGSSAGAGAGSAVWSFYLVGAALMHLGLYVAMNKVAGAARHDGMTALAGMYYRSPHIAVALMFLVLSLSGMPLSAGFIGKWLVLTAAAGDGQYVLLLVLLASWLGTLSCYFSILRSIWMRSYEGIEYMRITPLSSILLWLCAGAGVLLGLYPNAWLSLFA